MQEKVCQSCKRVYRTEEDFLQNTSRWRVCDMGALWFNCTCGSTLMLPPGKYPWYNPGLSLSDEAQSIFNTLANIEQLPRMPQAILRLQQLINEDADPTAIAKAMRSEPLIASELIEIAEQLRLARGTGGNPITSIEHAIVYVGRQATTDLITRAAIRSFEVPKSMFDTDGFWRESYLTGLLTEHLSRMNKIPLAEDRAYLSGSMANMGKLITAICYPVIAGKISAETQSEKSLMTWEQAEESYKFPSHTILGEIACALWGMPNWVMQATRYHHSNPKPGDPPSVVHACALANQMTHWILLQPSRINYDILESHKAFFKIDDPILEQIATEFVPIRDRILKTDVSKEAV